jgi:hypothetical protein
MIQRRSRNEEEDILRRQSMVLPDDPMPPSRGIPGNRGVTPRPPSMIEQHMNSGPISFAPQGHYGDQSPFTPAQHYGDQSSFAPQQQYGDPSFYGYSNQGAYNGGQVLPMPPQAWAPVTPHSSQPFFAPMGESPMGSPISPAPYDSAYDAVGRLVRQPSNGAYLERSGSNGGDYVVSGQTSPGGSNGTLSRQPSVDPSIPLMLQPGGRSLTREPSVSTPAVPSPQIEVPAEAHYVDLNRSSVSPFQAAQYAEISDRLQTAPPMPLSTPLVAEAADKAIMNDEQIAPAVMIPRPLNVNGQAKVTSPVTSPVMSPIAMSPVMSPVDMHSASPFSDPKIDQVMANADYETMPRPPSPTYSSKSRIDSTPPKLPEIALPQRVFSPTTMEFPSSPSARPAPSPLSATMEMPSSEADTHVAAHPHHAGRPDSPVYDEDDVYGGI